MAVCDVEAKAKIVAAMIMMPMMTTINLARKTKENGSEIHRAIPKYILQLSQM